MCQSNISPQEISCYGGCLAAPLCIHYIIIDSNPTDQLMGLNDHIYLEISETEKLLLFEKGDPLPKLKNIVK